MAFRDISVDYIVPYTPGGLIHIANHTGGLPIVNDAVVTTSLGNIILETTIVAESGDTPVQVSVPMTISVVNGTTAYLTISGVSVTLDLHNSTYFVGLIDYPLSTNIFPGEYDIYITACNDGSDPGSTLEQGLVTLSPNGEIRMYTANRGEYPGTGTVGWPETTISYTIASQM